MEDEKPGEPKGKDDYQNMSKGVQFGVAGDGEL